MANLLLPLVKGSRVVYLETLNTTELLRALAEREITAFAVVPQFFYLIHERIFKEVSQRGRFASRPVRTMMAITRFSRRFGWNPGPIFFPKIHNTFGRKMRYLVTGGSRFDPQIGRDFHALGIDILQAYGLTETSAAAFATSHDNVIGSVGKPLDGVEGKIVDPQPQEDGGQPVGEIAIRGAIVMKGYWNRPTPRPRFSGTAGCTPAISAISMPVEICLSPDARRKSLSSATGKTFIRRKSRRTI